MIIFFHLPELQPFQSCCAQPIFGLWRAPVCPPAASEDGPKVGHSKGEHLTKSPKSLVHSLHQALLSAQDAVKELTWENVSLREESRQMEEEVRETRRELCEGRRQARREIASLGESLCIQREENAARLSAMEDHWREVIRVIEENAATNLRESEEKWQRRLSQLEEEMKENRSFVGTLIQKVMAVTGEHRNTMILLSQNQSELCQSRKKWESKCDALEESCRKQLTEKEESWQRTVQEMERKNELGKMWLQKEEEWRQKTRALEDEIKCLTRESGQLQVNCLYRLCGFEVNEQSNILSKYFLFDVLPRVR